MKMTNNCQCRRHSMYIGLTIELCKQLLARAETKQCRKLNELLDRREPNTVPTVCPNRRTHQRRCFLAFRTTQLGKCIFVVLLKLLPFSFFAFLPFGSHNRINQQKRKNAGLETLVMVATGSAAPDGIGSLTVPLSSAHISLMDDSALLLFTLQVQLKLANVNISKEN